MYVTGSPHVLAKLSELNITVVDIEECLCYLECDPIVDKRPNHRTVPPTVWFVSPTYDDRLLFVAGIFDREEDVFIVRTARDATDKDLERWENEKW